MQIYMTFFINHPLIRNREGDDYQKRHINPRQTQNYMLFTKKTCLVHHLHLSLW